MKISYYETAEELSSSYVPETFNYGVALRDGHKFFLKKNRKQPSREEDSSCSCQGNSAGDIYLNRRLSYYKSLAQCRNGNIMIVHDFFKYGSSYYAVSDYISGKALSFDGIVSLKTAEKYFLTASVLYSYAFLNFKHVVHFNVKTANIMAIPLNSGGVAARIINFDYGFSENSEPEIIDGDRAYISPECYLKMQGMPVILSCKSDIFSLGIVLHEIWTGAKPGLTAGSDNGNCISAALCHGQTPVLSKNLPGIMRGIISGMLIPAPEKRISAAAAHALLVRHAGSMLN